MIFDDEVRSRTMQEGRKEGRKKFSLGGEIFLGGDRIGRGEFIFDQDRIVLSLNGTSFD